MLLLAMAALNMEVISALICFSSPSQLQPISYVSYASDAFPTINFLGPGLWRGVSVL